MTEQDIYKLLADGERVTLECKKAQNGVPNSLWEKRECINAKQRSYCQVPPFTVLALPKKYFSVVSAPQPQQKRNICDFLPPIFIKN